MNVNVNDSCIACGACSSMCSDVFYLKEKAEVNQDSVSAHEDCVRAAAEACPVYAIEVEE